MLLLVTPVMLLLLLIPLSRCDEDIYQQYLEARMRLVNSPLAPVCCTKLEVIFNFPANTSVQWAFRGYEGNYTASRDQFTDEGLYPVYRHDVDRKRSLAHISGPERYAGNWAFSSYWPLNYKWLHKSKVFAWTSHFACPASYTVGLRPARVVNPNLKFFSRLRNRYSQTSKGYYEPDRGIYHIRCTQRCSVGGAEAKQKFKDVPGVTKAFSGNVPPANWSEANHIGIHKCTKFEEQFVYHRCLPNGTFSELRGECEEKKNKIKGLGGCCKHVSIVVDPNREEWKFYRWYGAFVGVFTQDGTKSKSGRPVYRREDNPNLFLSHSEKEGYPMPWHIWGGPYVDLNDKMGNVKLIGRVTCPEDNKGLKYYDHEGRLVEAKRVRLVCGYQLAVDSGPNRLPGPAG